MLASRHYPGLTKQEGLCCCIRGDTLKPSSLLPVSLHPPWHGGHNLSTALSGLLTPTARGMSHECRVAATKPMCNSLLYKVLSKKTDEPVSFPLVARRGSLFLKDLIVWALANILRCCFTQGPI